MILELLTVGGLGAVAYSYLGYPALIWALSRLRKSPSIRPVRRKPAVSILFSAYNEEQVIAEKLANSLSLDWPEDRLEVVVVSDGSTDRTNDIIRRFSSDRIRFIAIENNQGKTNALNMGFHFCRGRFIVLTDANALYHESAIKHLVTRMMQNDRPGAVCGELKYRKSDGGAGENEGIYWKYEQFIKRAEGRMNSLIGANGSIYLIRKKDYPFPRKDLMDDLSIPLLITARTGKPTVYESRAVAYEEAGKEYSDEFRRKVRIITRAMYTLMQTHQEWFRKPVLAFQVISHKIIRWLAPYFLMLAFVSNALYVVFNGNLLWMTLVMIMQTIALSVIMVAFICERFQNHNRLTAIVYYFAVVNSASLLGIWNYLIGKRITRWKTIRENQ